jgi:hypothetical protein
MKEIELSGLTCYSAKSNVARSPISDNLNCLVLESDPTPGYYAKNNFPINKHVHDWHLYLPIKKQLVCFQDVILRNASILSSKFDSDLRIYPGQMTIQNENYACIRVNTKNIDELPLLIDEFKKLGVQFMSNKKITKYESLIYFKKYTELKKIEEGVFHDLNNENRYFFEVPVLINFDEFLVGMERIKNNCNYHLFDSFLSSIFVKNSTQDFIGIYSEHCDKNRFRELVKEIKKVFQN